MPPAACRLPQIPTTDTRKKRSLPPANREAPFFVVMTRYMDQLRVFAFTFEYVPQTFLPFTVV
jgi:hypothetical protein